MSAKWGLNVIFRNTDYTSVWENHRQLSQMCVKVERVCGGRWWGNSIQEHWETAQSAVTVGLRSPPAASCVLTLQSEGPHRWRWSLSSSSILLSFLNYYCSPADLKLCHILIMFPSTSSVCAVLNTWCSSAASVVSDSSVCLLSSGWYLSIQ